MAAAANASDWRLESFIEALIYELDKAQDVLSIKGINRKLTYTVKDVSVDLNVFPDYVDNDLHFSVARPGQQGASRISFQLGSITDRQIKETTRDPVAENDVIIKEVEELDPQIRERLERLGVKSARDLERVAQRKVALPAIVAEDAAAKKSEVSYKNLADIINKAKRGEARPKVQSMALRRDGDDRLKLRLEGENLFVGDMPDGFPVAMVNGLEVAAGREGDDVLISIPRGGLREGANALSVALDPFVVLQLELTAEEGA